MTPIFRSLRVVGYHYLPIQNKNLYDSLIEGDKLELRPVDDNKFDKYAVEVHYKPEKNFDKNNPTFVGYLPSTVSAVIHALNGSLMFADTEAWSVTVSNRAKNGRLDIDFNITE